MNRERGTRAKRQETMQLANSRGPWAKKSRNIQTDSKPHVRVISVLETDKER